MNELESVLEELKAMRKSVEEALARGTERPKLYKYEAAARLLSVDVETIEQMIHSGQLLSVDVGGGRIPAEEIDRIASAPAPMCLTYKDAAKRLGFGLTKLKEMVKRGDIKRSYPHKGGDPMISLAEIQRVSAPEAERPRLTAKQRREAWTPIPIGKKR